MGLIVFLLACYGVTNIVTSGRIFEPVRAAAERHVPLLGYWLKCPMCFGLPVGVGWALAGIWPPAPGGIAVNLACAGVVSSGFCWVMRVVLHRLGEDDL